MKFVRCNLQQEVSLHTHLQIPFYNHIMNNCIETLYVWIFLFNALSMLPFVPFQYIFELYWLYYLWKLNDSE